MREFLIFIKKASSISKIEVSEKIMGSVFDESLEVLSIISKPEKL
jgi:hypothetical protein